MTVEKVFCDECGRVKGEANHWHRMVVAGPKGKETIRLGDLGEDPYGVHDLCGEQCFYKHIAKLMGFTPETEAV